MTDRDALIAIMARAALDWAWQRALVMVHGERLADTDSNAKMMAAALNAAERAGWRFVPPDDGR